MKSPSNRSIESKVREFLKRSQVSYRAHEGKGIFEFGAAGSLTPLKIFLSTNEETNECELIGFLPVIVALPIRPLALWLVRKVNSQLEQGEYILGREGGGVFFHVSRNFSGHSSTWKDIKDLVDTAINHLDGFLPGLAAILSGLFPPEEALDMVVRVLCGEEEGEEVLSSRLQDLNGFN